MGNLPRPGWQVDSAHLVGNSYDGAAALRLAMDRPEKVGRMTLWARRYRDHRALPTKGLQSLFQYYGGSGPSRVAPEFVCEYLVFDASAVTATTLKKGLSADGVNPLNCCGADAWQTVFHLHLHVVPRYHDKTEDRLVLPWQVTQPRSQLWATVRPPPAALHHDPAPHSCCRAPVMLTEHLWLLKVFPVKCFTHDPRGQQIPDQRFELELGSVAKSSSIEGGREPTLNCHRAIG